MSEGGIELQESAKLLNNDSVPELVSEADRRMIRRVKWKTDLIILPLLVSIHFLAQMVGLVGRFVRVSNSTAILV